jgi:hypothetical protein
MQDKYWANSDVGQGPTGSCVVGYEWDGVLQGDADTPAGRQNMCMRECVMETVNLRVCLCALCVCKQASRS